MFTFAQMTVWSPFWIYPKNVYLSNAVDKLIVSLIFLFNNSLLLLYIILLCIFIRQVIPFILVSSLFFKRFVNRWKTLLSLPSRTLFPDLLINCAFGKNRHILEKAYSKYGCKSLSTTSTFSTSAWVVRCLRCSWT